MEDLWRLRLRRAGFIPPDPALAGLGAPAFVGKVVSTGANLAVGKFFLVNPVTAAGAEAEGGAGTLTVDTSVTIPVYAVGPAAPATGDYLICRHVDFRWVADKQTIGSGTTTPIATIPSCFCTAIPQTLTMTSSDESADFGTFRSGTIQWGPRPSWAAPLSATVSDPGFFGTATWPDPTAGGAGFIYYLGCTSNTITLTRLYETSPFGSPFRDGTLYSWIIGSPNTCNSDGSNFRMDTGTPYPGSDPVTVTVDGP